MTKPYRWLADVSTKSFGACSSARWTRAARRLWAAASSGRSRRAISPAAGETALYFARRGLRTYAVDLSPAMCRFTAAEGAGRRFAVRVIRADMRTFRLPGAGRPDHLRVRRRQSRSAQIWTSRGSARAASRRLAAGRPFLLRRQQRARLPALLGTTHVWFETPSACMVMRNGHDVDGQRPGATSNGSSATAIAGSGVRSGSKRSAGPPRQLRSRTGFDRVRAFDGAIFFPGHPLMTRSCRTIYLARKQA